MKNLLPLLCLAALVGKSQPYGETVYPHPNTICSSGTYVSAHPFGFIMGGYVPSAAVGSANFYIDKTGTGGGFGPASALPFASSYIVRGARNCPSSVPQGRFMTGVNVLDVQNSSIGSWYAVGGAYEEGSFYTALNSAGNVVATGFYPFPASAIRPTKPITIESTITPTEYYICGAFMVNGNYIMYINHLKETGTLISSMYYTLPNNVRTLVPADMLVSPYISVSGTNELVIVGQALAVNGSSDSWGFIMHVDVGTLAEDSYYEYGHTASTGRDAFGSITVANSPNFGNGFVIGGTTDISTSNGQVWALKVDPTGTVPYWNTIIQPVTDPQATTIVAIQERYSTTYGYTYYGAVTSTQGMMVLKLDDNGLPFVATGIDDFNEFLYPGVVPGQPATVSDLTFLDNTVSDIGIHVYGSEPGTNPRHYFVEAAFNGDSDLGVGLCINSSINTGALSIVGPGLSFKVDILAHPGGLQCTNFVVTPTSLVPALSGLCWTATLPAGGSNNRTTGIATQQKDATIFKISPNPVTDKLSINFTASDNDAVDIRLYDYLGRFVQTIPVLSHAGGDVRVAGLDMSQLNIESGVYIINATINGVKTSQKIIYTKGQ